MMCGVALVSDGVGAEEDAGEGRWWSRQGGEGRVGEAGNGGGSEDSARWRGEVECCR